ncbi:aminoacyl--tRNA ligase-related protein [Streptomyces sp. NBC_01477]|uniref:aminoacyl--tRNA ligase-related protein n=1 Tax=Streptomyces sp. NBC_01477 TaxID=2976015 RepID=UPI002E3138F5|nr:aminoacyl--tRNA ligase-related protein [Streptomyces sp. NBC_01477]
MASKVELLGRGSPSPNPVERLVTGGWALATDVAGVLGFTERFESLLGRLHGSLAALGVGPASWERTSCPPVVPRAWIERARYLDSFPHLLGQVHARGAGTAWDATDTVLTPAACYSVYPRLADSVVTAPAHFDVTGYCYRHEATAEIGRLRTFRMREFVTVGEEERIAAGHEEHIDRCASLFAGLGLDVAVQRATDPFFGPTARFLNASQMEQGLKYEFMAPVGGDGAVAIASANRHKDHLTSRFGIRCPGGAAAHSACTAIGLERMALALVHAHGDDVANWPTLPDDPEKPGTA